MHNNIMAAGSKDRPPMLATGRYAQWQSCFMRYVDTKPNDDALRKCILNEKEAIHLILSGIRDDIYSTVDACKIAHDIFISRDGESIESYYSRFYKMMNEMIRPGSIRSPPPRAATTVAAPPFQSPPPLNTTPPPQQHHIRVRVVLNPHQKGCSFLENQRDCFTNDTFRGRSLVSSAVYYEVAPHVVFRCVVIFGGVTEVATMQVNVQFLQQLQPEWSRFVIVAKQIIKLDKESYHKLFDILKQYQKEVNEIRAEKIARNANPLTLVAVA
ncbi:hypothetical protein Tco_1474072 [Tanacetum coccineum]